MLRIDVIGRLGRDASIKETNGEKVMHFPVCHSEKVADGSGNKIERVTWVTCFCKTSFALCEYLKKGCLVSVMGNLKVEQSVYNGKTSVDVICNVFRIELLAGASKNDGEQ